MEIFEINKKTLTILGLYSHENNNLGANYRYFCFVSYLVIYSLYFPYCSAEFVYKHLDQFSEFNFAILQLFSVLSVSLSAATFAYERRKIQKVIDDLQAIVNKSECTLKF